MSISKDDYSKMTDKASPNSPKVLNCIKAFLIGGTICLIGQILFMIFEKAGLNEKEVSAATSSVLIIITAILTGIGVFDKIARHAGAGTIVPITGFANSVVSPALEWKHEGFVLGTAAQMFSIAGPVIVYGTASAFLYGLIIFIFRLLKAIADYDKIEEKLKEMYEGNNNDALERKEFLPEFYQSVDYINDISNGFERAIQDRIKSERLKTELITNVSHDIKTPLTSIINYVDLLKKEDIRNEKANEYIEILDTKSQRLKKLIEDLVEASKVSTGNVKLNLEKINIVELLNQAIGEFEDKFESKKLEVILESKENEIYILADSRYMYRIVENLFSNISKYALENSRVYIDIIKKSNEVYIEMKNISKEKLNISAEELMQRFVRGDKSRTTEGSGLGISIAQNLTEIQKGVFNLKLDGDLFRVELIFNIL